MSINKWAPGFSAIFAILACITALDAYMVPWSLLLVGLGFIHGIAVPVREHASLAMVIAGAALFPAIADNFDVVPMVGPYLNEWVDAFAIAIAGYAVASLIHEVKARVFSD
jgi:hypothetical protein